MKNALTANDGKAPHALGFADPRNLIYQSRDSAIVRGFARIRKDLPYFTVDLPVVCMYIRTPYKSSTTTYFTEYVLA